MTPASVETFDFIVNRRGGAVLKAGEESVRAEILSGFGGKAGTFTYVEGKDVAAAVKAWAGEHAGQNRGLVIGGGDGTVITAVEQVLGREDITLGILPLGTVNGIARKLGFAADFKTAATQYKSGHTAGMDVGMVNGMPFLFGIILDQVNINAYEAREYLRNKEYIPALKKDFSAAASLFINRKKKFTVSNGNGSKTFDGRIFAVTPAPLQPQPLRTRAGNKIRDIMANIMAVSKENTGKLSFYAIEGGVKLPMVLPSVFNGTWVSHKSVQTESAPQFSIREDGVDDAQERTIMVDGEFKKTQYPLKVSIIPKGLRIFKPD